MSDKLKEQQWQQKLHESYQNSDALLKFILLTLDSFSYRYLNAPETKLTDSVILLESREENLGTALKIKDNQIKEGIKNLAKSVAREEKPAVVSRIWVEIKELKADKGEIHVRSEMNWSHPEHLSDALEKKIKIQKILWDDLTQFRKGFPLVLEDVCELFL